MAQVEKLKIFLASPTDVARERTSVRTVIDEINQTVAPSLGITLDLLSSGRAFPGFGKDGQALINEQLGDMQEYELVVAIFWKRIGTFTPRDISGTVEELARAIKTWRRRKKPAIWIYFSNAPFNPTTQEDLAQKGGVISFKSKLRGKGLWHEYQSAGDFATQFRKHLTTWLHDRHAKATTRRKPARVRAQPASKAEPTRPAMSPDRPAVALTRAGAKLSSTRKNTRTRSVTAQPPGIVKSPGTLVMLDNHFYPAKSGAVQADRSIVVRIAPTTMEQTADLQALQAVDFHRRREVTYADRHEAGTTQIQSVVSETSQEKIVFTVTLAPLPQLNSSNAMMEVSSRGYTVDDIAELRARLVLLGQPFPKEIDFLAASSHMRSSYGAPGASSIGTLPQLWTSLHIQPRLFLFRAWLYAAYLLKTGNIVESILALELGPIKDKKMRVKFRGRRAWLYPSHEPVTITIEGVCVLES